MSSRNSIYRVNSSFFHHSAGDEEWLDIDTAYASLASSSRKKETERKILRDRRSVLMAEIAQVEEVMEIVERWTPVTPEYQEGLKMFSECEY